MYQISNKVSLGVTEDEIVDSIENVVLKIIEQEQAARKFLKEHNGYVEVVPSRSFEESGTTIEVVIIKLIKE